MKTYEFTNELISTIKELGFINDDDFRRITKHYNDSKIRCIMINDILTNVKVVNTHLNVMVESFNAKPATFDEVCTAYANESNLLMLKDL